MVITLLVRLAGWPVTKRVSASNTMESKIVLKHSFPSMFGDVKLQAAERERKPTSSSMLPPSTYQFTILLNRSWIGNCQADFANKSVVDYGRDNFHELESNWIRIALAYGFSKKLFECLHIFPILITRSTMVWQQYRLWFGPVQQKLL